VETSDLLLVIARFFYCCLFVVICLSVLFIYIIQQGAQIPVTMLLWQLNFVFMGPQHETYLMSWFWYLELLGGSQIYGKFLYFLRRDLKFSIKKQWGKEVKIWSNIFVTIKVLICSSNSILHSDIHSLLTDIDGGCPPCCCLRQIFCYILFSW
jgi:hypothetical protein